MRQLGRTNPDDLAKVRRLLGSANGAQVVRALKSGITTGLWRPRRTERDFWTLSCLPATNKTKDRERLFTLNVSNVEVAYHYHHPRTEEDLYGALFVSTRELGEAATRLRRKRDVDTDRSVHAYLSEDETAIYFSGLDRLEVLLADGDVARALRARTAMLMQSGQVPSIQRRWHNAALAALVLSD